MICEKELLRIEEFNNFTDLGVLIKIHFQIVSEEEEFFLEYKHYIERKKVKGGSKYASGDVYRAESCMCVQYPKMYAHTIY